MQPFNNIDELTIQQEAPLAKQDSTDDGSSDEEYFTIAKFYAMKFPSYEECSPLVDPLLEPVFGQKLGEFAYGHIKHCFEAEMGDAIVVQAGKAIGAHGGSDAMRYAYYALDAVVAQKFDMLFAAGKASIHDMQDNRSSIKYKMSRAWDGIHGWQH